MDPTERALASALDGPLPGDPAAGDRETFGLAELAERTGVSTTLLEALVREGLLVGSSDAYTQADVEAVTAGLALLEAGVPLSEMLALAREHDEAMRRLADRAVDLFARYVRDPIRGTAADDAEAAERMVAALHGMLPAADSVVAHHFRRRLLAAAKDRLADGPAPPVP